MDRDDLAPEILKILHDNYELYLEVQKSLLLVQIHERSHPIGGLAKLRDITDHLFRASECQSLEELSHHRSEIEESLRRAGQETLQGALERRLLELDKAARWYFVRQGIYNTDVPSEREFIQTLDAVKDVLRQMRSGKGDKRLTKDGITSIREAYESAIELRNEIRPTRGVLLVRLAIGVLGALFSAAVGAAITLLISHWL